MKVVGLDPNPEMELYANQAADAAGLSQQQVQLLPGVAEQMPVADQSQDAVVCTLVRNDANFNCTCQQVASVPSSACLPWDARGSFGLPNSLKSVDTSCHCSDQHPSWLTTACTGLSIVFAPTHKLTMQQAHPEAKLVGNTHC